MSQITSAFGPQARFIMDGVLIYEFVMCILAHGKLLYEDSISKLLKKDSEHCLLR